MNPMNAVVSLDTKPSRRTVRPFGIALVILVAVVVGMALLPAQGAACLAQGSGVAYEESETPVGPVRKNRPPAPTGHTAENRYPDGFLTLSEPSRLRSELPVEDVEASESKQEPDTAVSDEKVRENVLFMFGTVIAVGLFLVVAWMDHQYRIRLQPIVSQNNRLLNGEDVDLLGDVVPVGIPLYLGTEQVLGEELGQTLTEYLSEPLSEEIAKLTE